MTDIEKVLKQDNVTYLKSKRISKNATLYITDEELVIESEATMIKGMNLLNSALKSSFLKTNKKIVIPINSIKSVKYNPQENTIEFVDLKNKDFCIEFKKTEDWIAMINSKIRIINN
ncbi:MAG TPA: hypothetical protein PKN32_10450 [Bacteroidales bacterium]|nr:hypothetical protein [Bacteroidales bacterium]